MLDVGERVKEYTLKRFLGSGTFGDVWLAEKRLELSDQGILFALKFLPNQSGAGVNSESVRQELNTWIKAGKHPNIIRVYDGFAHGRYLVIVSEYVEGGSLRGWLAANGRKAPSLAAAVEMLRGVLRGLSHLHARKIIHRDLKPENILLDGGAPAITDFGVSRMVESFSRSATPHPTGAAGSPAYMPPEAFGGASPLPSLDTWSAGVVFYEMLSGAWPFNGNSMYALFAEIVSKAPRPLPESVPRELQAFVSTALLKDAAQRFQTAERMHEALDEAWAALRQRCQWLSETVNDEEGLEGARRDPTSPGESQATKELIVQEEAVGGSAEDFVKRGKECHEARDYDGALENFNQAIKLNPQHAAAYYDRGRAYHAQGDYDRAFTDYNRAIQLNPDMAAAYVNRGNIYYKETEYAQALLDYNKAIQLNPQNALAYYRRGTVYFDAYRKNISEKAGNYDRAMRDFNKAIELNSQFASAYQSRGSGYYYQGDYERALADYDKAIELRPQSASAYFNRGLTYDSRSESGRLFERIGDRKRALADYDKAIELDPEHDAAYHNRARLYEFMGNNERALADYDKAIELNPHNDGFYRRRAYIYWSTGNHDKAVLDYNKFIESNPKDEDAYYWRHRAYEELKKQAKTWAERREYKAQAKADWQKFLDLSVKKHRD